LNEGATRIGWCHSVADGSAVFESPTKVALPKETSALGKGFLSCPAVRDFFVGALQVRAPFSLHLKFQQSGSGSFSITPVYPRTSIRENRLREFLILEPPMTWRDNNFPVLQIPSPYFFVADEPVEVEQTQPLIAPSSRFNWRLIPGRFNIYDWQRPLNWAIEWDIRGGDLIIREGEPLYYLRFFDATTGAALRRVELLQIEMTSELEARVAMTRGVTGLTRGLKPVMKKAGALRTQKFLEGKGK
jgi:hypothetical protein